MNGHVRKRGAQWEVILELGEQPAQRCPVCVKVDTKGRQRGQVYWSDRGKLAACPKCGGELEAITARRKIVLPDRYHLKKQAEARRDREKVAAMNGTFTEPDKLTLGEYLTEHWLPTIGGTVRPNTELAYQLHVGKRIVPRIGHIPLQKLGTRDIDGLYARLLSEPGPRGKPLSPSSCRAVHRCLHRALTKAVEWNLITRNPADAAEKPKPGRPDMRTWSGEQLALFLRLTEPDRLSPLWRTLAMTGLRRGEALALRWTDVDLETCRLTIRRSRVQVGYQVREQDTKTGKARVVAIDAATVTALRRQSERQLQDAADWGEAWQSTGHVFTREDGSPWQPDRITKLFDQAAKDAGLGGDQRIRLHDLRHTHATLALRAGIHPKVVSERLGHANISMTLDTYSHAIPALQESAAELVAALVDGTA